MKYVYKTKGTCASEIAVELEQDVIVRVDFTGGCDGNLKLISRLVQGMTVENAIQKCRGITCGSKSTSCSDQLSHAVQAAYEKENA